MIYYMHTCISDSVLYSTIDQTSDQAEQDPFYDTVDSSTIISTSKNEAYGKFEEAPSSTEVPRYDVTAPFTSQNVYIAYGDISTYTCTTNDKPDYYVNEGLNDPHLSMIKNEAYGDIPASTTRNDEQVNKGSNNSGMSMTQNEAYGDTSRQISSSSGTGSLDATSIPTTRNEAYTSVSTNTESVDTEEIYDYVRYL